MSCSSYSGVYASGMYYANQVSTIMGYVPRKDIMFPDSSDFMGGVKSTKATSTKATSTKTKVIVSDPMPEIPSSSRYYVDNTRAYTPMGFNMLLAISVYSVYGDMSLIKRFFRNTDIENFIINGIENMHELVKKKVKDSNGESLVEVSIKRSILIKMFFSQRNRNGSYMLSRMFLGDSSSLLSSNIRKIWGSLKLDIDKASTRGTKSSNSFLKTMGYRNGRSMNFEFVMEFPVVQG